jgi:16S rRNA (uracil1498-N3)-methyltransferase
LAQLQRLAIAPSQLDSQHIRLTAEQTHYLSRVLRLHTGDRFIALDGQGQSWLAELQHLTGAETTAQILQPLQVESELPIAITLVVALPKGTGFDDIVRQTTELGVTCLAPVISDRTLLKPSPQKVERWRRIAQEAAEQSERQMIPTILEPIALSAQLANLQPHSPASVGYFCATRQDAPHLFTCLQTLKNQECDRHTPTLSSMVIVTGPEGGWTNSEIDQAIALGYQPVSLGCRILRAVTAPLAALSLIAATLEATPDTIISTANPLPDSVEAL